VRDHLQILVTNDDGIHSPGLQTLATELSLLGDVVVVAPDRERSAVGHSLTLHSPLRAEEIAPNQYAVDGTPTDCVNLGIHGLIGSKPDLVVSGINKGGNIGDDLTYSGTVAAAMEATLMGVPAFAVSLDSNSFKAEDFTIAASFSRRFADILLSKGLPEDTFLNVNIPSSVPMGVRMTRQGRRRYGDSIVEKTDPRGRKYYWIGGGDLGFEDIEGTDSHAVKAGYVSVTPLHLDMTNHRTFDTLRNWGIETACDLLSEFSKNDTL